MSAVAPRFNPGHLVLRHVFGLLASSQASVAVMLHAAWILLLAMALLVAPDAATSHSATESLGRLLLRMLEGIGAIERHGSQRHADMGTVTRGLATLTPVIYLGRLLIARVRRGRAAWSMARKALLSMAIAALGYGVALVMLPNVAWSDLSLMGSMAVVLTGVATLWALLVRAMCDALLRGMGVASD